MILTSDLNRTNNKYEGNIYSIIEFQHVKSANSMALLERN